MAWGAGSRMTCWKTEPGKRKNPGSFMASGWAEACALHRIVAANAETARRQCWVDNMILSRHQPLTHPCRVNEAGPFRFRSQKGDAGPRGLQWGSDDWSERLGKRFMRRGHDPQKPSLVAAGLPVRVPA